MRVRGFVCAVIAGLLALVATAGRVAACVVCDPSLHCVASTPGAKFCVEGPLTCAMAVPCFMGGQRAPESSEEGLTAFTLFEAEGPAGAGVEHGAGPLELGEDARRGAPGNAGSGPIRGALVETLLAHGRDYAVMFVDAQGGGFALRRTDAGGAAHLEVLDVANGRPGRTLADATLGGRDRLITTVTVEGRERTLLVQVATLARPALAAELVRLRRALRVAARALPPRQRPLLELQAL
jgi:hypothetical protein